MNELESQMQGKPIKPEEVVDGMRVIYYLFPATPYVGCIDGEPWQLYDGTWVVRLKDMEPAYAKKVGRIGLGSCVFAACLELVRKAVDLNLDVFAEEARALHRVVRAMHDGHCPKCGYLGTSMAFRVLYDHVCPSCNFRVTENEAKMALKAFQPYLDKSVEVFEQWRSSGAATEED